MERKIIRVSHEEFERYKKELKELSDEELNKVAGGFCDPGCEPFGNGCMCDDDWDKM